MLTTLTYTSYILILAARNSFTYQLTAPEIIQRINSYCGAFTAGSFAVLEPTSAAETDSA